MTTAREWLEEHRNDPDIEGDRDPFNSDVDIETRHREADRVLCRYAMEWNAWFPGDRELAEFLLAYDKMVLYYA